MGQYRERKREGERECGTVYREGERGVPPLSALALLPQGGTASPWAKRRRGAPPATSGRRWRLPIDGGGGKVVLGLDFKKKNGEIVVGFFGGDVKIEESGRSMK